MSFTKESIAKELKRINDSVPQMLKDFTLSEVKKTPAIEMVAQKYLEEPNISKEKKEKMRRLLASGLFSKTGIKENERVAKMRDEYVTREIKKSVKEGRLPTKEQFRKLGLGELHDNKNEVL
jgi:hypothetical protein